MVEDREKSIDDSGFRHELGIVGHSANGDLNELSETRRLASSTRWEPALSRGLPQG